MNDLLSHASGAREHVRLVRCFIVAGAFWLCLPVVMFAQGRPDDVEQLRTLHSRIIRAHLENRLDDWMSIESIDYVSANGGRVSFPSLEERRHSRGAYLEGATFTRYRDLRDPVVRVAEDGSLGWLVAEVEVAGTLAQEDGSAKAFEQVWAWIELYARTPDGWRLVGNASNVRP